MAKKPQKPATCSMGANAMQKLETYRHLKPGVRARYVNPYGRYIEGKPAEVLGHPELFDCKVFVEIRIDGETKPDTVRAQDLYPEGGDWQ